MVNSWRAFRLRATVESSRMGWLLSGWVAATSDGLAGRSRPERTNAGPIRTGVRVAYPPTGCPTRRPSPARWCSYAYCRSLHITSFRSREPYPNLVVSASAAADGGGTWSGGLAPAGRGRRRAERPRAPDRGSGPRRAQGSPAARRRHPARCRRRGSSACSASASGRRSGGTRRPRRSAPATAGRCPCRTRSGPTSVARPVSCSAPATISLADALPPSMRHDDPEVVDPWRRRRAARRSATWAPVASCSQNTGPEAMNWLATARAAVT